MKSSEVKEKWLTALLQHAYRGRVVVGKILCGSRSYRCMHTMVGLWLEEYSVAHDPIMECILWWDLLAMAHDLIKGKHSVVRP